MDDTLLSTRQNIHNNSYPTLIPWLPHTIHNWVPRPTWLTSLLGHLSLSSPLCNTNHHSLQKALTFRSIPTLEQSSQHHQWIQHLQTQSHTAPDMFTPTNIYWNKKTNTSIWHSVDAVTLTGFSTGSKQKWTTISANNNVTITSIFTGT